MEIENLFQKINKKQYETRAHKDSLRFALQNNQYFEKKQSTQWQFNLAIPSLTLSFSILIFTGMTMPYAIAENKTNTQTNQQQTLYSRLLKNSNVNKAEYGNGIKSLQIKQENVKTSLYFNKKNILIRSEANK